MNFDKRETLFLKGASGRLEIVMNRPKRVPRAIALVAHPHPLFGGTLDNKVVQTLASAFTELNCIALRMNFRGVGESAGEHDNGVGESEDMLLLAQHAEHEFGALPLFLAGFSFGAFVQTRVASRLQTHKLVLVAPAVGRFDVAAVANDTLVIHGELDATVPLADILDWARPQNLPVVVIPGAEHFFHRRLNIIKSVVLNSCRF